MEEGISRGWGELSQCAVGELDEFRVYLLADKGVVADVATNYVRWSREFVVGLTRAGGAVDWSGADAAEANRYVAARGRGYARKTVGVLATAVRALLAWAYLTGRIPRRCDSAVLRPADWQASSLPRALSQEQMGSLLDAVGQFERTPAAVLRDRATLLLLSRLGLRSGEVAGLRVDDIDWRAGLITVRGKGRQSTLPLPVDVGEALVAYLRAGRPGGHPGREVFTTAQPPLGPWSAHAVTHMVGRAARRAGLGTVHAHRLRHTAATRVLAEGGSLADVSQLLGHARLQTSAVYAKTDLLSLRGLVVPWGVVDR
ncbi:MAG: tyrosine-type recombinase/integrase [Bifidobacteriaceae bacterium]|nr:tyrosine-type recombinase/integrase [Bifidobacteriaceae bacterium]